ncbi:MAG: Rrf2 family transcriptional regulator [Planctomycetes bacterium]|nr:Rrf2 family transcriptional regulator [Planctomycetota bacterium]
MRMSRASAYAIGAVLQLAEAPVGVPVPCSQLAKTGEMPERFLLQVLRNLVNHKILKSTRGVDGGYSLARPADEVSLLQILEATDGPMAPEIPPLECIPPSTREELHSLFREISAATCRRLAEVCVLQLLPSPTDKALENKPTGTD